jgi:hypothetical protein
MSFPPLLFLSRTDIVNEFSQKAEIDPIKEILSVRNKEFSFLY